MKLVGLSGYAQSGKDAAAEALVANGWTRLAFADIMRDFLERLNPIIGYEEGEPVRYAEALLRFGDYYGVRSQPQYTNEIRVLMQRLGTDCGRALLGDNIWVDSTLAQASDPDGKYVLTDVRFPNEAEAIQSRGGLVYRIKRPGVGPANNHASELSLEDYNFDFYMDNNGSLEDWHEKIRRVFL